jgi:succinate dehydrogenase / fumarate reductase cytochrome b subunit
VTSWVLLIGIIGHVVQMRFLGYPTKVEVNDQVRYLNRISFDPGLYTLSARLHVTLYSAEEVAAMQQKVVQEPMKAVLSNEYSEEREQQAGQAQRAEQEKKWVATLSSFHLRGNEVIAEANAPGTAMLLMVRDHFKNPLMAVVYTIFVLAASFHAFNGFWTALITWGAMLSYRSQKAMLPVSMTGIAVLAFLGLAAIWGSYWMNLRS